ncbi:MAG: hypothetical protein LBT40_04895 [Deltaproteobacteria bacterium]|jgi:hypothetical protein|nr:hypothetical protein [Deltaproteobacteria bacterium]
MAAPEDVPLKPSGGPLAIRAGVLRTASLAICDFSPLLSEITLENLAGDSLLGRRTGDGSGQDGTGCIEFAAFSRNWLDDCLTGNWTFRIASGPELLKTRPDLLVRRDGRPRPGWEAILYLAEEIRPSRTLLTDQDAAELFARLAGFSRLDGQGFREEDGHGLREETGQLFLAIFNVRWMPHGSNEFLEAPLALVPARLELENAGTGEVWTVAGLGGPRPNFALLNQLERDFGLDVRKGFGGTLHERLTAPDLERLAEDTGRAVRDAGLDGWRVKPGIYLGRFRLAGEAACRVAGEAASSFAGEAVRKDLAGLRELGRLDAPLCRALLGECRAEVHGAVLPDPARLDQTIDPEDDLSIFLADASQLSAVRAAAAGASFILAGPDGAGRTRTVGNMIAQAVGDGKRVLYVSGRDESRAAVKSLLDGAGLGRLCLDLHGLGQGGDGLAARLKEMADADRGEVSGPGPGDWLRLSAALRRSASHLDLYYGELHEAHPCGLTPYAAMETLAASPGPTIPLRPPSLEDGQFPGPATRYRRKVVPSSLPQDGSEAAWSPASRDGREGAWSPPPQEGGSSSSPRSPRRPLALGSARQAAFPYASEAALAELAAALAKAGSLPPKELLNGSAVLPPDTERELSLAAAETARLATAVTAWDPAPPDQYHYDWLPDSGISERGEAPAGGPVPGDGTGTGGTEPGEAAGEQREAGRSAGGQGDTDEAARIVLSVFPDARDSLSEETLEAASEALNDAEKHVLSAFRAADTLKYAFFRGYGGSPLPGEVSGASTALAAELEAMVSCKAAVVGPVRFAPGIERLRVMLGHFVRLSGGPKVSKVSSDLLATLGRTARAAVTAGASVSAVAGEVSEESDSVIVMREACAAARIAQDHWTLGRQLSGTYDLKAAYGRDLESLLAAWSEVAHSFLPTRLFRLKKFFGRALSGFALRRGWDTERDLKTLILMRKRWRELSGLSALAAADPGLAGLLFSQGSQGIESLRTFIAMMPALFDLARAPGELLEAGRRLRAAADVVRRELCALRSGHGNSDSGGIPRHFAEQEALRRSAGRMYALAGRARPGEVEELAGRAAADAAEIAESVRRSAEMRDWLEAEENATRLGLCEFVAALENGSLASEDAPWELKRAVASLFMESVLPSIPRVARFDPDKREESAANYRGLRESRLRAAVPRILARARPAGWRRAVNAELRRLATEAEKEKGEGVRLAPRDLLDALPALFPVLCRCVLASPEAVAKSIPDDVPPFALVIYDDASEINVWEALGALARSTAVVATADPPRMSPVQFPSDMVGEGKVESLDAGEREADAAQGHAWGCGDSEAGVWERVDSEREAWGCGDSEGDVLACGDSERVAWGCGDSEEDVLACGDSERVAWGCGGGRAETREDKVRVAGNRCLLDAMSLAGLPVVRLAPQRLSVRGGIRGFSEASSQLGGPAEFPDAGRCAVSFRLVPGQADHPDGKGGQAEARAVADEVCRVLRTSLSSGRELSVGVATLDESRADLVGTVLDEALSADRSIAHAFSEDGLPEPVTVKSFRDFRERRDMVMISPGSVVPDERELASILKCARREARIFISFPGAGETELTGAGSPGIVRRLLEASLAGMSVSPNLAGMRGAASDVSLSGAGSPVRSCAGSFVDTVARSLDGRGWVTRAGAADTGEVMDLCVLDRGGSGACIAAIETDGGCSAALACASDREIMRPDALCSRQPLLRAWSPLWAKDPEGQAVLLDEALWEFQRRRSGDTGRGPYDELSRTESCSGTAPDP